MSLHTIHSLFLLETKLCYVLKYQPLLVQNVTTRGRVLKGVSKVK